MKKSKIASLILIVLIITCIYNLIYAETVQITKEEFVKAAKDTLEELKAGTEEEKNIVVTENEVIVSTIDKSGNTVEYPFNYELGEKIKFWKDFDVNSETTYNEYQQIGNEFEGYAEIIAVGFAIIANYKGMGAQESGVYALRVLLDGDWEPTLPDIEINKDDFKAMDVMNQLTDVHKITDELLTHSMYVKDKTENSCKLTYEMTVDQTKDFAIINSGEENKGNNTTNETTNNTTNGTINNTTNETTNNIVNNTNTSNKVLPRTGENNALINSLRLIVLLAAITLVSLAVRNMYLRKK